MQVLEKAKEMNDVVLAKNKDGQFLMNRLKERLTHNEQRRNEYLERSIEKIKEHNSSIYSKMEQREEKQASEEVKKRDDFHETLKKIRDKNKEKDEMIRHYASELREKQSNAMQNAKERKSTLDKQTKNRLDLGIQNYNSRYIEKTSRIAQETQETSRLKSAMTSQRISDTKNEYIRLKNKRLQLNAALIKKHEDQSKTLIERREMLTKFNDMTRTFNFSKNAATSEFKAEMVQANKLSPIQRKKFVQANSLYEKLGASNLNTGDHPSPETKQESSFFLTQTNPNSIPTKQPKSQ